MSSPLAQLFQACDPMEAATPEQYVDCSDVRGGHAFTDRFCGALRNAREGSAFLRYLFTGHIGGGKSSELVHLQTKLESEGLTAKPYVVVMMDAREYIDDNDVTPNDILLAIVSELAATVKEKVGVDLDNGYLKKRFIELVELLGQKVESDGAEFGLGAAKLKFKLLKQDENARRKVREALDNIETPFVQAVNDVFEDARMKVRRAGREDVVLVLDNLEKIQRLHGVEEGSATHKELFISKAQRFVQLSCHFVLTVPLSLVRTDAGQLRGVYGSAPFTLPMVKVLDREGRPYSQGIERLHDVLETRGATDDVIEPEARDKLIRYSGGHVRDLLGSLREAIGYCGTGKVEVKHADAALGQIANTLAPTVGNAAWQKLAELERDPNRRLDPDDPICAKMLEQLFVLEYVNGGSGESAFQSEEPWYAVHPILRELRAFKSALAEYDARKPQP